MSTKRKPKKEIEFIDKLWNSKNEYGDESYIILFVPCTDMKYVDFIDHGLFDEIWSFSEIHKTIEKLVQN